MNNMNNMDNISKICLNMIVKNESKIIQRLLLSVFPLIDTYCICDTGSDDNTIELIETFFAERNMTGKIVREPFRDFGYNRTFAMKQCIGMPNADYLLLVDADMILEIDTVTNTSNTTNTTSATTTNITKSIRNFKSSLCDDAYFILQGTETFFYKNVRILRNNPEYSYWGVTHEYVKTPANTTFQTISKSSMFLRDVGDGGSKTDKTERDIRLLKKGLEDLPDNDRYTFYLANSYRDIKDYENAVKTYKKRIQIGGWIEEVWYSYYCIGKCLMETGDIPTAISTWLNAYEIFPDRIENIYEIISHYRKTGNNKLAYMFYHSIIDSVRKKKSFDHLFLEKNIYDYLLDYEFSIIAYYYNPDQLDVFKASMNVLANLNAEENIQKNVLNNYKFYDLKLKTLECHETRRDFDYNFNILRTIGDTLDIDRNIFISSTPSIAYDLTDLTKDNVRIRGKKRLLVNVRFVNYRIDDNGQYINQPKVITRNIMAVFDLNNTYKWKKIDEFELKYNTEYDTRNDNMYVGLEDIRLYSKYGSVEYNANRGVDNNMYVEHGYIHTKLHETANSSLLKIKNQQSIEKNWVCFAHDNETRMIYKWSPLTIGVIIRDQFQVIKSDPNVPSFFKWVRGSTNGVIIDDEIWFICHLVNYEERRHYYHLFVVLDCKTNTIKKYSKLFTFEGEKVEYTLGFVYIEELKQMMIGYSTLDRETKYMLISKNKLDEVF